MSLMILGMEYVIFGLRLFFFLPFFSCFHFHFHFLFVPSLSFFRTFITCRRPLLIERKKASGGNRPNPPRAPRKKPVEEEDGDADAEGEGDPDAEGDDLEAEGALAGGGGDDAEAAP